MKLSRSYIPFLLLAILGLVGHSAVAQVISFKTLASDPISIQQVYPLDLEFGGLVLNSSDPKVIQLNGENDDRVVVIAFDAPAAYDVNVYINSVDFLENLDYIPAQGESVPSIPFQFRVAYANPGFPLSHTDLIAARNAAVEVPAGFNTLTFPVSKRAGGLPAPPPTPEHVGYSVPMSRAYLFFYGVAGPTNAGTNVVAGLYQTEVVIELQLANYD